MLEQFNSEAAMTKWTKVAAEQLPVSTEDLFWVNVDIARILTQKLDPRFQDQIVLLGGRLMRFEVACLPNMNNPEQVVFWVDHGKDKNEFEINRQRRWLRPTVYKTYQVFRQKTSPFTRINTFPDGVHSPIELVPAQRSEMFRNLWEEFLYTPPSGGVLALASR
jgi:hypothetical protein